MENKTTRELPKENVEDLLKRFKISVEYIDGVLFIKKRVDVGLFNLIVDENEIQFSVIELDNLKQNVYVYETSNQSITNKK